MPPLRVVVVGHRRSLIDHGTFNLTLKVQTICSTWAAPCRACGDQCKSDSHDHIGRIWVLTLGLFAVSFFAGSLLCSRRWQLFLTSLQLFLKRASPTGAVSCENLPGIYVNTKCLHVFLAHIFLPQLRPTEASLLCGKLFVEDVFVFLSLRVRLLIL